MIKYDIYLVLLVLGLIGLYKVIFNWKSVSAWFKLRFERSNAKGLKVIPSKEEWKGNVEASKVVDDYLTHPEPSTEPKDIVKPKPKPKPKKRTTTAKSSVIPEDSSKETETETETVIPETKKESK